MPGPQRRTISRQLGTLGQQNIEKASVSHVPKLIAWVKEHPEDSAHLWRLVENGQIKALKGEAFDREWECAVLYKGCNRWEKIQKTDMKFAFEKFGILSRNDMWQLCVHDNMAIEKLFSMCTAKNDKERIAPGTTHHELAHMIGVRLLATGRRWKALA
eukprot:2277552-Lingulodinium_polyedra.AAC.1